MLYHFGTLDDVRSRRRLARCDELAILLLTPGFARAFHANVLEVSSTTIAKYVDWSHALACRDSSIRFRARQNAESITPEDGLKMAQRRRRAQLPWWSHLAIAEYVDRLGHTGEVARLFKCSRRTVQFALKRWPIGYDPFTGERRLSHTQASPPGQWASSASRPCAAVAIG
jgi:hypothetical protein